MALADTYDAITSKRIYRDDNNFEYAYNEIKNNLGSQFDPEIGQTFLNVLDKNGGTIVNNS